MFSVDERADRPQAPAGLRLATIARRVGTLALDQVIVVVPIVAVAVAIGFGPGDTISEQAVFNITIASLVVSFVYYTLMIGFLGRTVGSLATGTRVVRAADGGAPSWTSATLRALVPLVAGAVPTIGFGLTVAVYAMALLDPLRRGLHDRAAATLVVRRPPAVVVGYAGPDEPHPMSRDR